MQNGICKGDAYCLNCLKKHQLNIQFPFRHHSIMHVALLVL